MTEQKAQENQRNKTSQKVKNVRPQRGKRQFDPSELRGFLDTLTVGVTPSIHVNGISHPTAVVTVDFGAPLQPVRLTQEQVQELMARMRKATKDLFGSEINVRVSSDHHNGVFWSSVS